MSSQNEIEFKVRVTDEGLAPLASALDKVDRKTDELGKSAATTGKQLGGMGQADALAPLASTLDRVDGKTDELGKSAATTGQQLGGMGRNADAALDSTYRRGMKAAEGIDSISMQLQRVQSGLIALGLGNSFVGMIQGAAQTADQYNNLAARIKLATGEGELFEQAMESVERIALATNSSLEGTGTLFARLTDAGKSAGLATQDAAAQALELTESINQSIAVSGASAQAGDAALTQLIQGLQSGVLRGEEFNSVMEQSPRLAKALADGLGVTTGALRTMANEGQLTTDVVIGALKSQAATLKSEFETLPPTVGRAVQNLSTAWTVYIGETDKATGASALAAQAIGVLAENLDTIAGYLLDAGQAAAAFAALRLAQTFLGIGAAARTAAAATAAATASTVANTAAQVANTAAAVANSKASATAAASAGRFAAVLGGLKLFSLLGIVTNFKDIGTAIGEATAKVPGLFNAFKEGGIAGLVNYKTEFQKLAELEREREYRAKEASANRIAMAASQAAADKEAIDAQFRLSAAAKSSVAAFDELVAQGSAADDALSEIGKDFDLASIPGIANAAAVLDKLAADGKLSAEQFSAAWGAALKGEDLQVFEVKARAALAGTARESERLAAVMNATLREAIRRSGGDFEVLSGGMGKAARSAINDLDTIVNGLEALKSQGVNVGQALELSLSKAINTADGQKSIDELRARIERMRKELGEKVTDGLLADLQKQAEKLGATFDKLPEKAKTYAERVAEAFKDSGVKTQAELDKMAKSAEERFMLISTSGKASAEGVAQAWRTMAEAQIAANGGVASEVLKAQAATYGLEIAVDKTGKTIVRAMGEGRDQTDRYRKSLDEAAEASRGLGDSIDREYASRMANKFAIDAETRAMAAQAEQKRLGIDAEKFSVDAKGNRIVQEVNNRESAAQKLQSMGLDEETAARTAAKVYDERGNYLPKSSGAYREGDTLDAVLMRLAEQNRGAVAVGGARPGTATPAATGSTSHTVTLKLGGKSTTVNTASRTDADNLTGFLNSLQEAASRAG